MPEDAPQSPTPAPALPDPMNAPALAREQLGPEDLAELIGTFNEVTTRLQSSHESLQREVARLRRELGEANDALERSRRLAALGEMAAGIAHEIRNPLGSIALYARLLEEDLEDHPEQRETAGKVRRAVHGLERIVRDVLAFAREIRVDRRPATPGEIIDAAVDAVFAATFQSCVRLVRRDAPDIPPLCADAGLLTQALTNVLRNAAEAVDDHGGGEVAIELERREAASADADGPGAMIRVIDDGPGVTPEVVERMFNPFFTTRKAGTGLGLAIVHRIVDAHAGRVRVRNRADEDTRAVPGAPATGTIVELFIPDGPVGAGRCAGDATSEHPEPSVRVPTRADQTEQAA